MSSIPSDPYYSRSNAAPEKRMARLNAKTVIEADSGCWTWTGTKTAAGYGQMRVVGKAQYVHRISWELHVGPIPEGLTIDHLCRNRACVNPAHMEVVTLAVNCGRANGRKTHCPEGHPYSGDNLRISPSGWRQCRACDHKHNAARWQRTLAKRQAAA